MSQGRVLPMRDRMVALVRDVQDRICADLEELDGGRFREDSWERPDPTGHGGGGRARVLQGGRVLEKAGVNTSAVHGRLSDEAARAMRATHDLDGDAADERRFFATGISLVLHPVNPHAPTVHANFRYFELGDAHAPVAWWFGGGADLTPCYLYEDDARHFHQVLAAACDRHDPAYYPRFKPWCDRYFHLKHRQEARGVGGIFFDDLQDRDPDALLAFVDDCARSVMPAWLPIARRRHGMAYGPEQVRWQRLRRARYVEFNLVWDRGTLFGLRTDARVESVLMSLPLHASWEYDHHPDPGSPEAAMVEVLKAPRDWLGRCG